MTTIKQLRYAGYKVRVLQKRKYKKINKIDGVYEELSPKGGETYIEVTTPDKTITRAGESICSMEDHYDRKKGNQIALGRAIKALGDSGHTLDFISHSYNNNTTSCYNAT